MPPEFPPKDPREETLPISIRLKRSLWERIDTIADLEQRSRNEVVQFFLEWAVKDWEMAQARKKK